MLTEMENASTPKPLRGLGFGVVSVGSGLTTLDTGAGGSQSWAGCQTPRFTASQRTQYPLIKEYTLNYRGLSIMISGIFLN